MFGFSPARGRRCTTSMPSTGSRFRCAINLPPARRGPPGLISSTGGNGVTFWDRVAQLLCEVLCILYEGRNRASCLLFPLLPLLQAAQPWHAASCGRSLGERASVLRPTCRQHVAGQRDGPEVSGGGRFRLGSMRDETNRQSAQNVPWVTLGSLLTLCNVLPYYFRTCLLFLCLLIAKGIHAKMMLPIAAIELDSWGYAAL